MPDVRKRKKDRHFDQLIINPVGIGVYSDLVDTSRTLNSHTLRIAGKTVIKAMLQNVYSQLLENF